MPTAKNWVTVENGNILRNMLGQILTSKLTVKQAAQVGERQHRVRPQRMKVRRDADHVEP